MSNLSDIGFPVNGDEDINEMIISVMKNARELPCPNGFYLKFSDESGAQIYLQGNKDQELIGFNPHFEGKSRRKVSLARNIERDSSPLDGGFYVSESFKNQPETPMNRPYIFDAPDFRTNDQITFPADCEIQLTAFASNDFENFKDEKERINSEDVRLKNYIRKSFSATGLFAFEDGDEEIDIHVVRPIARIYGEILELSLKTNSLTNQNFYHFLVSTEGGEIDVVADPKLVSNEPKIGEGLSGQFWISGRLIKCL